MTTKTRTGVTSAERPDVGGAMPLAPPRLRRPSRVLDWALPSAVFALLALVNARRAFERGPVAHTVFAVGGTLLWIGLFAVVQKRPAPARRERAPLAVAAALAATFVTIPIGAAAPTDAVGRLLPAIVLLVAGCGFSLWAIATLGSRFGVLADARGLVMRGPYRIVRHPLYLGELVNLGGLVVGAQRWQLPLAAWLGLLVVQLVRSVYEERVLEAAFVGYGPYRTEVRRRILPGVI